MRANHSSDHPIVFGVEIGLSRQNDRSPCSSRRRRRSQPPKPPRDAPRTPLKARGGASRAPRRLALALTIAFGLTAPLFKTPGVYGDGSSSPEANPGFDGDRPGGSPGFYFPRRADAAPRRAPRDDTHARDLGRDVPRPPPAPPRGRPAQASLGAQAARSSPRAARRKCVAPTPRVKSPPPPPPHAAARLGEERLELGVFQEKVGGAFLLVSHLLDSLLDLLRCVFRAGGRFSRRARAPEGRRAEIRPRRRRRRAARRRAGAARFLSSRRRSADPARLRRTATARDRGPGLWLSGPPCARSPCSRACAAGGAGGISCCGPPAHLGCPSPPTRRAMRACLETWSRSR